ncbi:MAG: hypothetical protein ACJAT2_000656 [Bacteriovoracaceae bacterium]|jgi:hypothetical protein
MKGLTLVTFLMVLAWMMEVSFAGEVTGAGAAKLLVQHEYSVTDLKNSGHKILFGELTGAGKRMNLDRVKLVITKTKVFEINKADHVEFKHPSNAKSLSDVSFLEFGTQKVGSAQIEALVVK